MELFYFITCWTPVLLLTILAIFYRRPALDLSVYGTAFTFLLVIIIFKTPLRVALLSSIDGVLTTLPLLLVIFSGILLSILLMTTGSLVRIVNWLEGGVRDAFQRNILITLGVGNFMEGAGVIAEPVVAPMLQAAGVSPKGSAILSIAGYAGLMTLEMAGIIITVLSLVTGIPVKELGITSAWLSLPATVMMAVCVPLFLPGPKYALQRLFLVCGSGFLLGMTAIISATYLGVSISGIVAGSSLILAFIFFGPRGLKISRQIAIDLAPFGLMLVALLLVNTVPLLKIWTFKRLIISVHLIPIHAITFRPFFSAYIYLFLAFILAATLHRVPKRRLCEVLSGGTRKGWRAFVAMGFFGAMGQMIAYSGYTLGFESLQQPFNIPWVLSNGLKLYAGGLYPLFVPFLGWVGTFLTGYGVASLMLFGQLQVQAAGLLGVSAAWLSAGLAVGASIGSISSPFKIALATPMCGAVGQEGAILRLTIPLGIAAAFIIGIILLLVL